jgi:hypothetical protein
MAPIVLEQLISSSASSRYPRRETAGEQTSERLPKARAVSKSASEFANPAELPMMFGIMVMLML